MFSNEGLDVILRRHRAWLHNEKDGERADLSSADLRYADLRSANLYGADLRGADLYGADLCSANLYGADLCSANLYGADLHSANLCGANLYGADLRSANLSSANLRSANLYSANLYGANLRYADLCGANLCGANLYGADLHSAEHIPFIAMSCPEEGAFIGYKKAGGHIIKLQILEDAKRSSATSRKCRCNKAKVLSIENIYTRMPCTLNSISSDYDSTFVYEVGKIVSVDNFDDDRWNECAPGIHFFINREEAVNY